MGVRFRGSCYSNAIGNVYLPILTDTCNSPPRALLNNLGVHRAEVAAFSAGSRAHLACVAFMGIGSSSSSEPSAPLCPARTRRSHSVGLRRES